MRVKKNNFNCFSGECHSNPAALGCGILSIIKGELLGNNDEVTLNIQPDGTATMEEINNQTPTKTPNNDSEIIQKNVDSSIVGTKNVPSAFKRNLFWPTPFDVPCKVSTREHVSAVASSSEWINYHTSKQDKRRKSYEEKEARKKLREGSKSNIN